MTALQKLNKYKNTKVYDDMMIFHVKDTEPVSLPCKSVMLHNTIVACVFTDPALGDCVRIQMGGWGTPTTRRRINQVFQAVGMAWNVYQRDYEQYVGGDGKEVEFEERMVVTRSGGVLHMVEGLYIGANNE